MGLVTTTAGAGKLCGRGSDLLLLDLENWRKPGHALRRRVMVGACARLGFYALSRRGWLEGVKALGGAVKLVCVRGKYSIWTRALATIGDDSLSNLGQRWWLRVGCGLWLILLLRLALGILWLVLLLEWDGWGVGEITRRAVWVCGRTCCGNGLKRMDGVHC